VPTRRREGLIKNLIAPKFPKNNNNNKQMRKR
jgi:hypothetical protein